MSNKTLAILKPDCVRKNLIGKVVSQIQEAGFKVSGLKMVHLTEDSAKGFYEVHSERPFFNDLIAYMTSGPCVPIALEKENAENLNAKLNFVESNLFDKINDKFDLILFNQPKRLKEPLENYTLKAFKKILFTVRILMKMLRKKYLTSLLEKNF